MRSLLIVSLALLMICGVAYADLKDNLLIGVEYSNVEKKVDDAVPLSLSIFNTEIGVIGSIKDVDVSTVLANIGYKISDNLIPYVLVGDLSAEYIYSLKGYLGNGSMDLLTHSYEQNGIAYGFGARGKLVDLPKELRVMYDVRHLQARSDDTINTSVLGCNFPTDVDVNYGEWNAQLILTRDFAMSKFVQSISPYVGYRYTSVQMGISNDIKLGKNLVLGTEYDVNGNLHSLVAGTSVRINDHLTASVNAIALDEEGVMGSLTYNF